MMTSTEKKGAGGRPPKFDEPSRPITVTLPERVLGLLASVNTDRARAISKLAEIVLGEAGSPRKPVELVKVASGKSIILVAHSVYLQNIPWLRLVEVAPARHLLSLLPGTSVEQLEIAIGDLLEVVPEEEANEREILKSLLQNVRSPRRHQKFAKEEILFVESHD